MHFCLAKLIEVSKKIQDMGTTTPSESQRWAMVLQVLSESVPVPSLLRFVSTRSSGRFGALLLHHFLLLPIVLSHDLISWSASTSRRSHSIREGPQRVLTQNE